MTDKLKLPEIEENSVSHLHSRTLHKAIEERTNFFARLDEGASLSAREFQLDLDERLAAIPSQEERVRFFQIELTKKLLQLRQELERLLSITSKLS